MFVSSGFIHRVVVYINNIRLDIDSLADDTFDMERAERLRMISSQLYTVVKALQGLSLFPSDGH